MKKILRIIVALVLSLTVFFSIGAAASAEELSTTAALQSPGNAAGKNLLSKEYLECQTPITSTYVMVELSANTNYTLSFDYSAAEEMGEDSFMVNSYGITIYSVPDKDAYLNSGKNEDLSQIAYFAGSDSSSFNITGNNRAYINFTTGKSGCVVFYFGGPSVEQVIWTLPDLQLEVGNVATAYEAYSIDSTILYDYKVVLKGKKSEDSLSNWSSDTKVDYLTDLSTVLPPLEYRDYFVGWTLDKEGTEFVTSLADIDYKRVTVLGVEQPLTLWAQYDYPIEYKVTFKGADKLLTWSFNEVLTADDSLALLTPPEGHGQNFIGWYYEDSTAEEMSEKGLSTLKTLSDIEDLRLDSRLGIEKPIVLYPIYASGMEPEYTFFESLQMSIFGAESIVDGVSVGGMAIPIILVGLLLIFLKPLIRLVKSIWKGIKKAFSAVVNFFKRIINAIKRGFNKLINKISK